MIAKIRSAFMQSKFVFVHDTEGELSLCEAMSDFSMPGINFKAGDRFWTPTADLIEPTAAEKELAELRTLWTVKP